MTGHDEHSSDIATGVVWGQNQHSRGPSGGYTLFVKKKIGGTCQYTTQLTTLRSRVFGLVVFCRTESCRTKKSIGTIRVDMKE